jgi:hypothetical protein
VKLEQLVEGAPTDRVAISEIHEFLARLQVELFAAILRDYHARIVTALERAVEDEPQNGQPALAGGEQ